MPFSALLIYQGSGFIILWCVCAFWSFLCVYDVMCATNIDEDDVQGIKSLYVFTAQVLQDLQPSVVSLVVVSHASLFCYLI